MNMGKKNLHFFKILKALQSQIRTISSAGKEISDQKETDKKPYNFYKNTLPTKTSVSKNLSQGYLHQFEIPSLSAEHAQACEGVITENEILMALRKMPNSKSPGNGRIKKELYETFWEHIPC